MNSGRLISPCSWTWACSTLLFSQIESLVSWGLLHWVLSYLCASYLLSLPIVWGSLISPLLTFSWVALLRWDCTLLSSPRTDYTTHCLVSNPFLVHVIANQPYWILSVQGLQENLQLYWVNQHYTCFLPFFAESKYLTPCKRFKLWYWMANNSDESWFNFLMEQDFI